MITPEREAQLRQHVQDGNLYDIVDLLAALDAERAIGTDRKVAIVIAERNKVVGEMKKACDELLAKQTEHVAKLRHALSACAPSWLPPGIRDLRRKTLEETGP